MVIFSIFTFYVPFNLLFSIRSPLSIYLAYVILMVMRRWVALDDETAWKLAKLVDILGAELEEDVVKRLVDEAYKKYVGVRKIRR